MRKEFEMTDQQLQTIIDAIGPDRFVISMDTNGWLLKEEKRLICRQISR